ncbi:MAG: acyl transferase [Bacteroidota bacterium]
MIDIRKIFTLSQPGEFEVLALETFHFQYAKNKVYREFCDHLGILPKHVLTSRDIPHLPIEFFKTRKILCSDLKVATVFTSSGTTGQRPSRHYVADIGLYQQSYLTAFAHFYGSVARYCVLALLPAYLEREGSSLVHMVNDLIQKSGHPDSGFYLNDLDKLSKTLIRLNNQGTRILLLGVSFALLDLVEKHRFRLRNTIVMETGGMKGRRRELIRSELHQSLREGFGVEEIHSEYGMTELLSQAYSKGKGVFRAPPWMKVMARDTEDPLSPQKNGKTGGLNIMDLANLHSCSFIATQDLGKVYADGSFEVLGRFDHSDIRGCNLMVLN